MGIALLEFSRIWRYVRGKENVDAASRRKGRPLTPAANDLDQGPAFVRVLVILGFFAFAAFLATAVLTAADFLQLRLTWLGFFNLGLIAVLVFWHLCDTIFERGSIYRFWGRNEPPFDPQFRLWRRIAFVASSILTIATCLVVLTPPEPGETATIARAALPPVAVLTAAFLATLGWMYTAFEKERTDRAGHTLTTIREQLSGDYIREVYSQIRVLSEHYRIKHTIPKDTPLPSEAMLCTLAELPRCTRPKGRSTTTLGNAVDQFFNALDHIAFGVREGQFDFRSMQKVLRQRFIRSAFIFFHYIKTETNAVETGNGLWRARTRTWEHYLWLVNCLEILPSDKVDRTQIVLPPGHKVPGRARTTPAPAPTLPLPTGAPVPRE